MKPGHTPADLRKAMEAAAPGEIDLRFKPMFGGIGAYADGRMFASLSDAGLALKLGDAAHAELLKLKGAKPLQYEPGAPVSKTYVVVPDAMLADRRALRGWIEKSANFVKTLTPKKPRKPGK
ncbi:MAG TPA: TfoX/Sxy family protein [Rhizomicrobium sp.]|jgi:TfoX/Sxy family transcriptional regulator of competence genes